MCPFCSDYLTRLARELLLGEGEFFDEVMQMERKRVESLQSEVWKEWRLNVQGNLPKQLQTRGVGTN